MGHYSRLPFCIYILENLNGAAKGSYFPSLTETPGFHKQIVLCNSNLYNRRGENRLTHLSEKKKIRIWRTESKKEKKKKGRKKPISPPELAWDKYRLCEKHTFPQNQNEPFYPAGRSPLGLPWQGRASDLPFGLALQLLGLFHSSSSCTSGSGEGFTLHLDKSLHVLKGSNHD